MPAKPKNEFVIEDDEVVDSTNGDNPNTPSVQGQAMSLEDLDNIEMDDDAYEADRKTLYPPPGDWVKTDRWDWSSFVKADDTAKSDINPEGRTFYRIYGKPDERTDRVGVAYQPFISFMLSPDKRYSQKDPTKVDNAYKLFLQARDLYIGMYGHKATKHSQWMRMLVDDTYTVKVTIYNGDIFVQGLKPNRKK